MHIYFSGIGGMGIGPLALVAKQAGYEVSGSDAADSAYIKYLAKQGITDINIGQTTEQIAKTHAKKPIDWFVYSSALPKTNPNHPELVFCQQNGIKTSKRDEFLNEVLDQKHLKLIAVAGTHGKTTTTAMVVWLLKQLGVPTSYSVGAKVGFGDMGEYDLKSQLFVYECDEFDRNFLSFHPHTALITGIDWDHPDIYPTREEYYQAFHDFLNQSEKALAWHSDLKKLEVDPSNKLTALDDDDPQINQRLKLAGLVNRQDAWLVAQAANKYLGVPLDTAINILNKFPGLSRRFEQIVPGLYTDYAHTPAKTRGALQMAHEVAGENVVVVYEGLHNTRQHFIKNELASLFDDVKKVYVVPTYLAREDPSLELLTPEKIVDMLAPHQNPNGAVGNRIAEHPVFGAGLSISAKQHGKAAQLDEQLKQDIQKHLDNGDLVLCLSAGGPSSLDEWLRKEFR